MAIIFQVVQEYERAVIFRLGRLLQGGSKGPGESDQVQKVKIVICGINPGPVFDQLGALSVFLKAPPILPPNRHGYLNSLKTSLNFASSFDQCVK